MVARIASVVLLFSLTYGAVAKAAPTAADIVEKVKEAERQNKKPEKERGNPVYIVYFDDYDDMYKACGLRKCCRASVRAIRREKVNPEYVSRNARMNCPEGYKKTSLRCPASLIWCQRRKLKDEIEDREKEAEGAE